MLCCCGVSRTHRIREVIDHVATVDPETGLEQLIFSTGEDSSKQGDKYIRGNPVSFLCTNINSIMGGRTNLWASGKDKEFGLTNPKGQTIQHKDAKIKELSSHDDDHLEF